MWLGETNFFQEFLVHFDGQISNKIKVHQNGVEMRPDLILMKLGQQVAVDLKPLWNII